MIAVSKARSSFSVPSTVARNWLQSKLGFGFGLTSIARLRPTRQTRMFRAMLLRNVQLGTETVLTHPDLVNLYGCLVGDGTKVGPFVEIQKNSHVGVRCRISSHTFICEGVRDLLAPASVTSHAA